MISFFEIPAADFSRAVAFYEGVLNVKLEICDCGGQERMAFFPCAENEKYGGAVSQASGFRPGPDGTLIHLRVEDLDKALAEVEKHGGKILLPPTQIQSPDGGRFALFLDSEGNRLGLHSE